MARFNSPLDHLKISAPCPADWDAMTGNDSVRFCGKCQLNVYNLSGMTRYDAENLLRLSEGRLCVRYFKRPDGTILTQDCPVGWAKVKQRVTFMAAAAFSMVMSLFGAIFVVSSFKKQPVTMGSISYATPTPTPTPTPALWMGNIALPTPTPKRTLQEVKGEFDVTIRKVARGS